MLLLWGPVKIDGGPTCVSLLCHVDPIRFTWGCAHPLFYTWLMSTCSARLRSGCIFLRETFLSTSFSPRTRPPPQAYTHARRLGLGPLYIFRWHPLQTSVMAFNLSYTIMGLLLSPHQPKETLSFIFISLVLAPCLALQSCLRNVEWMTQFA